MIPSVPKKRVVDSICDDLARIINATRFVQENLCAKAIRGHELVQVKDCATGINKGTTVCCTNDFSRVIDAVSTNVVLESS